MSNGVTVLFVAIPDKIATPNKEYVLNDDDLVRCHSYLISYMKEHHIADFKKLYFEVIPVKYITDYTPMIACWEKADAENAFERFDLLATEKFLDDYVESIGIQALMQLSSKETLTWQKVLDNDAQWQADEAQAAEE